MSDAVRALVACHGDLAAGLVSAVAQITGRGGVCWPLSNYGLGAPQLEETLRAELVRTGAATIFTDLPGGSWTIAARRVLRDTTGVVVVTGVNLAMLLDFVFHDALPTADAARSAVERGQDAMLVLGGSSRAH